MLPWWLSGKEPAWWFRRCAFNPWVRKIPLEKKMATYFSILSGRAHGQKSMGGYSPWGQKRVGHDVATCCCTVAQSCTTLCHPVGCSPPDFPVLHHLLEFAQTYIHLISHAIEPSHPLSLPSPLAFDLSQHQGLFNESMNQLFASGG